MDYNELSWKEDERAIGYVQEGAFREVIGSNFMIDSYILTPNNRYRGYVVTLKPLGCNKSFRVIWNPDWASIFG